MVGDREGRRTGATVPLMRVRKAGAVVLAVLVAVVGSGCGDEGSDEQAGTGLGAAAADQNATAAPGDGGGSAVEEGDAGLGTGEAAGEAAGADGPPAPSPSTECVDPEGTPEIPADATPPTTIPGSEPSEVPNGIMSEERLPQFGALVVDVGPQGCIDIPTRFRAGQRVQMLTHADDGKVTHIEVFAPDGHNIGQWDTGEPETIEGYDFYNDTPLPADGVYVFRVTHQSGSDEPFMIAFYGQA